MIVVLPRWGKGRVAQLRFPSEDAPAKIVRVYEVLQDQGVKAARWKFEKEFRMPVTDERIDREIELLFEDALVSGSAPRLPFRAVLAVLPRERAGRRRFREPIWSSKARAVERTAELMAEGLRAREAAERSAKELGSNLTADQILEIKWHADRKRKRKSKNTPLPGLSAG
jgi:uncharacterized protein YoaH (UPF0181 family)